MVKQLNKFKTMKFKNLFILFFAVNIFSIAALFSQEINLNPNNTPNFVPGKDYILGDFSVVGLNRFSEQTVKVHTGLIKGSTIKLPGDKLTSAIKRLYETKQFSKVDVYITKVEGDEVSLEFDVEELPQLDKMFFNNIGKTKSNTLQEEVKLKSGDMVTENLLVTTQNLLINKYKKEGFLNAKVNIETKNSEKPNAVNLYVDINKGDKVKINKINFHGIDKLSEKKLKKVMKKTKQKMFVRVWKKSKYIEDDFKSDLQKIIDAYSEKGLRDAMITEKKITKIDDNNIDLDIYITEGIKYYIGNINFIGNSVYSDEQLMSFLRIEKGDVYNSKILKDRVSGDGTPESNDIQSLYLNNGYLFANVTPVETKVENDSIDVEIRVFEDEPATIRKITVNGNDKTNDNVIFRELRTQPGNLFSKEDIIRSIREISQLGFFDAEKISPDVNPNYVDKTVDINYTVAEKGSSQIELQGGYGGKSFIGTLGLSFNNFSVKDIFKKDAYQPLPMGDGQTLNLRLQKSKYYSTYSFSFTEPWWGGKKPKSLSFSVYNSRQIGYNYLTGETNRDQGLNIWGASFGLGQRLKWPDDYFSLSQSIGYQRYEMSQYNIFGSLGLDLENGVSNNINYNIVFARKSSGPNPIFPTGGSEFSIGLKATPPFSLLNNKDYSSMTDAEKYKWLEYYKTSLKAKWYTPLYKKLVLMTNAEFGLLGYYNNKLGYSPFEKFVVGGDGLSQYRFDGSETIGLRGYENGSLSASVIGGGTMYNKFTLEARYPITLKASTSIYGLAFVEAGNSYYKFENYNPFNMKRSAGAGLRIFMPQFGLLGIDFAYGFDPLPGAVEKSGWQTHFIIGQQF